MPISEHARGRTACLRTFQNAPTSFANPLYQPYTIEAVAEASPVDVAAVPMTAEVRRFPMFVVISSVCSNLCNGLSFR